MAAPKALLAARESPVWVCTMIVVLHQIRGDALLRSHVMGAACAETGQRPDHLAARLLRASAAYTPHLNVAAPNPGEMQRVHTSLAAWSLASSSRLSTCPSLKLHQAPA